MPEETLPETLALGETMTTAIVRPPIHAIRQAIFLRIRSDSVMQSLMNGTQNIIRRPGKLDYKIPRLTYFDFGDRPDITVPLFERTFQWDIWVATLEHAEKVAWRLIQLLDGAAISFPQHEARIDSIRFVADRDIYEDNATIVHKSLDFEVLAYALIQ